MRLVVFDATDTGWTPPAAIARPTDGTARGRFGLAPIWATGARIHGALRFADAWLAARSWEQALTWAVETAHGRGQRIRSLQAWGHGGWGFMAIGPSRVDERALLRGHPLAPRIDALREALAPDGLVWFRCCSAFGHDGRHFGVSAADRLGVRVAGHTYVIGFFQSGTHSLRPGSAPGWDPAEGVARDGAGIPKGALKSSPGAPNTITCMRPELPPDV